MRWACELRLVWRQIRDLEHLVAAWEREIGRRYASLDQSLRTIPGLGPGNGSGDRC